MLIILFLLSKQEVFYVKFPKIAYYLYFYAVFHLYKIIFYLYFVFLYIVMYITNIARDVKKMSVNEMRDLSLKTIVKEFDFLRKMKHLKKNDLLLLANKLIEKLPDLCNAKERKCYKKQKHKINKTIRNDYLSTKNFCKPKQCCYKISYYRTPENFS